MASSQSLRAPEANNRALVSPDWDTLRAHLRGPAPDKADVELAGTPLKRLAAEARRDLLDRAFNYTSQYADPPRAAHDDVAPLVLSGHQPELFHSGVWFKNFALDALAKASRGVGVHLLIDSDLCRTPGVRAPTGSVAEPRIEPVLLDARQDTAPYEERPIVDANRFDSFGSRVAELVRPFVERPLAETHWGMAVESRRRGATLGQAVSEFRHRLELEWGAQTLELPLSAACDTEAFHALAGEMLARPADTIAAYNGALADFRQENRVRNAAQPLPDLAHDGVWCESPLWVWSDQRPTRRSLHAQTDGDRLRLTDHSGWTAEGPSEPSAIAGWLAELREAGVKVRSRALVTTLYTRLVLADLFLHGIGGARYDQVTDRFAERLLGVRPPWHATLTATLRLPIDHNQPGEEELRRLRKERRDLRYHGEWFLPVDSPAKPAARRKAAWVATAKTPTNAAERHAAIEAANLQMSQALEPHRRETAQRIDAAQQGARARRVIDSREHAFCLFPADDIRQRLAALCPAG